MKKVLFVALILVCVVALAGCHGKKTRPLDMSEEERAKAYGNVPEERWFNNRPVWQRVIVIAAGPLMNLVLAVLLYGVVAAIGANVPETEVDNRIGAIVPNSPAAAASLYAMPAEGAMPDFTRAPDATGWKTGDRIVTIDDKRVRNIMDVRIDALLGAGRVLNVEIERLAADGSTKRYLSPVEPKPIGESTHPLFGVGPFETALVKEIIKGTPAEAVGLQDGDVIVRADGRLVDTMTFVEMVEKYPEGTTIKLDVQRGNEMRPMVLQPDTIGRFVGLYVYPADGSNREHETPVVDTISKDLAEKTNLKPKDIIEQINGQPATAASLREFERTHPGATATLAVRRPAIGFGYLRAEERLSIQMPVTPVRAVGVKLGVKMIFHRTSLSETPREAVSLAYQALARTMRTLTLLVTGAVSPKELGGPVLIYQVTTSAARAGYSWLLNTTAFISVNLCVFNLLPLPILDGSQLVYLAIEGVRRKPLNVKILERIQQAGLVLIVSLLLYVTFNDFSRILTNMIP